MASDRVEKILAEGNPRLSLARLGIDMLPEELSITSRVTHITALDLKHNRLQLLPSELFLCLTQLEDLDVSEVRRNTHQSTWAAHVLGVPRNYVKSYV